MSSAETRADSVLHSPAERQRLLEIAARSIDEGLACGHPLAVELDGEPPALREEGASFVTLRRGADLRGCIGSLEPSRPLAQDVAHNAFQAAFRDPRFPPLEPWERPGLDLHIAVLGPFAPLEVESEEDLIALLRPGVDGLVLAEGARRATFLPAVWASLAHPRTFVHELKRKAGLPADYWSPNLRFARYETESIP